MQPRSLIYWLAARTGRLIASPRLNIVTVRQEATRTVYIKRRCWYAVALITMARLSRPRFRVLPTAAWHVWETAVYQQIYQQNIAITNDGALILPAMPGRTLAAVLLQPINRTYALAVMTAAIRALSRLHQQSIMLPDGTCYPFSHGDATIANVTYDRTSDSAYWFDFETAHNPASQHAWCCADDLRALLFSAGAQLGMAYTTALAQLIRVEYPEPQIQHLLRKSVLQLMHQPDVWHLAQTHLPYSLHYALCNAVITELS
jgi:hypothetical protein